MSKINVFIRQPFTESGEDQRILIQGVMDTLVSFKESFDLDFLVPTEAQCSETFRKGFESSQGVPFTPFNFRKYRLSLLDKAQAFINIRVGLSESSAFEISYNIFKGTNAPLFFAVHKDTGIKTTLLRELQDLNDVTYVTFDNPAELAEPLRNYFEKIRASSSQDCKVTEAA